MYIIVIQFIEPRLIVSYVITCLVFVWRSSKHNSYNSLIWQIQIQISIHGETPREKTCVCYKGKSVTRNKFHTIIHFNVWALLEMYFGCIWSKWDHKIVFYTKCWFKNRINFNKNIIHNQNLTMNITAKRHEMQIHKNGKFWSTLKSTIYDLRRGSWGNYTSNDTDQIPCSYFITHVKMEISCRWLYRNTL